MPELDSEEFDRINNEINKKIMQHVRESHLLDAKNTKSTYQKRAEEFDRESKYSDVSLLQLSIAFQQMKDLILSLKEKITELDAEFLVVSSQMEPNVNRLRELENKRDAANELLKIALNRFSTFSKSKFRNMEVASCVANFKSLIVENNIIERATGTSRPFLRLYSTEAPGMIDLYKEYQQMVSSVDYNSHGLAKYRDYMSFMLSRDSNGVSNRRKIREYERAYAGDIVLANPNYKKGKNTLLDMSRHDAYRDLGIDLPIKEFEINKFVKENIEARDEKGEQDR